MDGLSSAASVIAVIQVAGSLVSICGGYIQRVKHARDDIITLQRAAEGLRGILQGLLEFLKDSNKTRLPTSPRLVGDITDCLSDLRALKEKLESKMGKRSMKKFGFRAWRWPLERAEVDGEVQKFESSLMAGVAQNTHRINQNMDFGKLESVAEASFDSFSNRDEIECLQGTRVELLRQIMEWATSPCQKSVFWLNGMAGTGKSTISRTVAKSLKNNNHLGASFFFKRGEGDRGNAKKFFPTLIKQLMLRRSELSSGVQKALRDDPDIASKWLGEQFDKLLLKPLLELDQLGQQPQNAVIVIDALDECEHDQDIRNILRLLPLLQKAKTVRLRIFLTSRPELPIRLGFSDIANHEYQDLALHDISEEVTKHDIHLFLKDRFTKIRLERDVPQNWPSDDVIQQLVTMSVPLFISAATVCRYVESKLEPTLRLAELLKDQAKYVTKMDKTYLPILTRLLDGEESDAPEKQQLLHEFQEIVGIIILLAVPLSINTLSLFLGIRAEKISNRLDSFRSVLSIPSDRDLPIRILHLSFRDFLVQPTSKFFVDEADKHKDIAFYCLKTMRYHLKRNICDLKGPGTHSADLNPQSINQSLPPELQYSCRYWIHHFEKSKVASAEIHHVLLFLRHHFLHWVEAMCLLGLVSEIVGMLNLLRIITTGDHKSPISDFLHDARRFILKNRQIADKAPLQLYYAGLVFAPGTTIIRREFETELPTWICQLPNVDQKWSAQLQALEGHSDLIWSVAFSPDGRLLASGSDDKTVRLWDPSTGALQQTFEGHSDSVWSVAFSPDGQLLASGSDDKTVRLWKPSTGALQQTLEGHLDSVTSVAFSPDGQLLASGSNDKTVRLWNPTTGALQQTFEGHSDSVWSVAFSPDGQLLASGSDDKTVRLWDPSTGALQQALKGHLHSVQSVAFSPDGQLLASGSYDETVRLWDPSTGALKKTLEDHSTWVRSVDFSPDGRLLATGSYDGKVRLWDPMTGILQQTLEGHSDWVWSVDFSPDGRLLASGSNDQTVRLWDPTIGGPQQTLEGHLDSVWSVAFSPDGQLLASGSYDKTVQLWDPLTGALQQTLKGHLHSVTLVVFSPNGQLLASASRDQTVLLWDPSTGALQQTLKGHSDFVWSVAFSSDGHLLASASRDQTVRLWDPSTGALQQTLKGHSDSVWSVAFSPSGRLLASGSRDQTVRLWDPIKGALQQTLEGHSHLITSVAFSLDGQLLASGSRDQTVRLWDTVTGDLQHTWTVEGVVTDLEFTQGGSCISTNLGALDIRTRKDSPTSNSAHVNLDISIEHKQWIRLNGEKVIWLPTETRPTCSAVKRGTLALGHASGRVSFMGFRV